MKRKTLIGATFTLLIGCFSVGVYSSKAEATEQAQLQETEYVYKLLGEELSIGGDVISVQDPKGNMLTPENGKILLDWASGSYTITYPTYIQDVRVYEKMPTDKVLFQENMQEFSPTAGLAVELPKATIIPGVYRTDGGPNPENYAYEVNVYENGTLLETVAADEEYTFEIGGAYTLSYTYENVFGISVAYDTQIEVLDEKVIVSHLLEGYGMSDGIAEGDIFGYYKGVKYPTTITITAPSGKTSTVQEVYHFNEVGVHNVYAETTVEGVELTLEKQFDIVSTLDDFIIATKSATPMGTLDKLSSTAFASNAQSYQVYATGLSAQLDYNGVIDLRKFDKNESIVEIVPNVLESEGRVEQVKITLTDVYDSANTVTIGYLANSNRNGVEYSADNVLIYVVYGTSGRVANANYFNMPQYAVGWYTSMYGYWTSTQFSKVNSKFNANMDTLNVAFDVENNVIYTHGIFYEVPAPGVQATPTVREWYPLLDFNDKSLAKPFQGFTTGEVYVKIETTGVGDIGIANIGKHTCRQVTGESYQSNDGILLDDEAYSMQGVVGIEFPVTKALPSKYMETVINVEVRDPNGSVVPLKNNAIIPSEAGVYTITYSAVNEFGIEVQKTYALTVLGEPTPIDITYDVSGSVLAGEWYVVKAPNITGGNGNVEYTITLNGQTVTAGETFKIVERTEISIEAQDSFGQRVSKTWELNVDYNNVETEIIFPRSAFVGENFTIPKAYFYEYATKSYNENYTVTYNGNIITEKTLVLPAQPCKVEFTYSLNGEYQKTYELNVLNKAFKSAEEVFNVDGEIVANALGTRFKVDSDSVISFPHLLSSDALNITFFVLESELNFDAIIFTLTAPNEVQQQIMLRDLDKDKVSVYANGVDTKKTINRVKMIGTASDPEEYRNKTYYTYEFVYEETQRALIVNDKIIYSFELDCNGKAFDGFGGGVYLDISFQSKQSTASILIRKVSNQVLSDLAYSDGDIVGPQVYSNGLSANCRIAYGETMDFSTFQAFDVLSGASTLTLTLQLPDGSKKFENASLADLNENTKITADIYGTYRLTVRMRDANGATSTAKINYVVEDLVPPEIVINGKEDKTYDAGKTVALLACSASDNSNGKITYMVIAHMPLGSPLCLYYAEGSPDELKIELSERGKYKICYYAIDAEGNIAIDYYYIMAR